MPQWNGSVRTRRGIRTVLDEPSCGYVCGMGDRRDPAHVHHVDDVAVWVADGTSVHIKAVTEFNDPVELSGDEARSLAELLLQLAGEADTGSGSVRCLRVVSPRMGERNGS